MEKYGGTEMEGMEQPWNGGRGMESTNGNGMENGMEYLI